MCRLYKILSSNDVLVVSLAREDVGLSVSPFVVGVSISTIVHQILPIAQKTKLHTHTHTNPNKTTPNKRKETLTTGLNYACRVTKCQRLREQSRRRQRGWPNVDEEEIRCWARDYGYDETNDDNASEYVYD